MFLVKRKHGSQRASKPVSVKLDPNWSGQGGSRAIHMQTPEGDWISLVPETVEDVRELMSQAHILHHNFRS